MQNYEFGAGLWMFQQFVDRYATDAYGPPVDTLEAIDRAAAVGDIKVLDINYPFAGDDVTVAQVRETLQRTGLRARRLSRRISTCANSSWAASPTPTRPCARRLSTWASRRSRSPTRLDARYVKFWPGQDGFDYPFQVDYRRLWDYSVAGCAPSPRARPTCSLPSNTR